MDLQGLTPALERLWIEEVRYLHSLWRHGPPPNNNPNPNPNPNLRPLNSTSFKKESQASKTEKRLQKKKEKREKRLQKLKLARQQSDLQTPLNRVDRTVSEIEWPVQPPPPQQPQTGWGDLKPQPAGATTRLATAEEQAKFTAIQLQRWVLKSCRDFFKKEGSDGESEDDEEDDDLMDDDEGDCGNFKFFLGLFTENGELRNYYEKNWEQGEFFCLVCGGIGEKIGKRFGNCVALVQHSTAIAKTKRRGAHRAFGKAVCRVLGWNMDRLPSIVLDIGEPLGRSLAKASSEEGVKEDGVNDQKEDLQKEDTESVEADMEN
ncbi:uncharacterized protein LOC131240985 [Magnolia sinica]|uniref:uncharacterized protein LOC131240985 n=1 Tax=Magnolia sinica TaxID=86752 RepID=UPI0026599FF9|nr:uncharacterized protein LOC131240985 [Magnolia sinica]